MLPFLTFYANYFKLFMLFHSYSRLMNIVHPARLLQKVVKGMNFFTRATQTGLGILIDEVDSGP